MSTSSCRRRSSSASWAVSMVYEQGMQALDLASSSRISRCWASRPAPFQGATAQQAGGIEHFAVAGDQHRAEVPGAPQVDRDR